MSAAPRGLFPLGEFALQAELERLNINPPTPRRPANVRAKATGEYRQPEAGEWYLSGGVIEAWRAKHRLAQPFYIARLVRCVQQWVIEYDPVDQEN